THSFELLKSGFGIVAVVAPGIAFPGQPYDVRLSVIDFTLDANKTPKGTVSMKITDEAGKDVSPGISTKLPEALDNRFDAKKDNILPFYYGILPNRPGRFNVELHAFDAIGNNSSVVRYPLVVLDINALLK
ncbi:MAG TPA: hypothetical protein VHR72_02500, partial [Gemmataceae bacterium]|nr:hypothetical protein [Gemmataceae bacterium]